MSRKISNAHGQSSSLLGSFLPFLGGILRPTNSRMRTCRMAAFVGVWLLMAGAVLHYSFYDRISQHLYREPIVHTETSNEELSPNIKSSIPAKIWQIFLRPPKADKNIFEIDTEQLPDTPSWLAHNPDYQYVLVGDSGVEKLLKKHFRKDSKLSRIFKELKNTGMRSDLLRYLLLSVEDGVYADIDVEALKPIGTWVPEEYLQDTQVVIGVEFDRLNGRNWGEVHEDLQFCQWTIAAAPGHPLLRYMADFAVAALYQFAREHNTTLGELDIKSSDVMKLTGPSAWTDAVFHQLQQYEPEFTSVRDLTGLTKPRLVGDILILPIDGFGMGQQHSHSTNDGTIPDEALVQHKFRGSWRHDGSLR